jgi:hypothetical protein
VIINLHSASDPSFRAGLRYLRPPRKNKYGALCAISVCLLCLTRTSELTSDSGYLRHLCTPASFSCSRGMLLCFSVCFSDNLFFLFFFTLNRKMENNVSVWKEAGLQQDVSIFRTVGLLLCGSRNLCTVAR